MNSAYVAALIGAVAGLVTGLGSALIALKVARSQEASARELQRRQWRADTLRDCYSQVGGNASTIHAGMAGLVGRVQY